jgi:hypothetical protein
MDLLCNPSTLLLLLLCCRPELQRGQHLPARQPVALAVHAQRRRSGAGRLGPVRRAGRQLRKLLLQRRAVPKVRGSQQRGAD